MAPKGVSASRQPPNVVDEEEEEQNEQGTTFTLDQVRQQIFLAEANVVLHDAIFDLAQRRPRSTIDVLIRIREALGLDNAVYKPQPK
jgi:hypothetical protein